MAQMDNVLNLELPRPVPYLADIISILFLDVKSLVKLDCWHMGGFYGKLVTNLVVVPACCVALCFFIYTNQRRTIAQVIKAGAADESAYLTASIKLQHNLFFGIFLL